MGDDEQGGESACWAHLLGDGEDPSEVLVDLGRIGGTGESGVVWNLQHGGDLDANLVHLAPHALIDEHAEHELDVLVVVLAGAGVLTVDGEDRDLRRDVLALLPRGARRRVGAGPLGLVYLSVHRRRDPLRITRRPGAGDGRDLPR